MKKIAYSFLIVSFIGLMLIRCEKKDDDDTELVLTGQLIANSTCKSDLKSSSQDGDTPDSISSVEYSFDEEQNILTLKHINASFNCCPDCLYCTVELKGDTILIEEFEQNPLCYCNCLYDLDIEVTGVDSKIYQVEFVEPYASGLTQLLFEIDLMNDSTGIYSVIRDQYPWGVSQY
jgi:hypothetical protein